VGARGHDARAGGRAASGRRSDSDGMVVSIFVGVGRRGCLRYDNVRYDNVASASRAFAPTVFASSHPYNVDKGT